MNQLSIDDSDNVDDIYNHFAIGATHILDANRNISGNNIDHMNEHGASRENYVAIVIEMVQGFRVTELIQVLLM